MLQRGPLIICSVVVCTYNRANYLDLCLDALAACGPDQGVEILVIDNNSTDCTTAIVEKHRSQDQRVRYLFEPRQGLSAARNRGLVEAQGAYIAFIDDDARPNSHWVSSIIEFFLTHSDAGAVGGPYTAFAVAPLPEWIPEDFGCFSLGSEVVRLGQREWLTGTNMAFRKDIALRFGGFDERIGMRGENVAYGEETNLQLRLKRAGIPIYYDPKIRVEHAITPYKTSLRWLLQASYRSGQDGIITFEYKGTVIFYFFKVILVAARSLGVFVVSKDRYFKARAYHSLAPLAWHFGFLARLVRGDDNLRFQPANRTGRRF